jgi:O-antigen/teichoic acid export membrane protein
MIETSSPPRPPRLAQLLQHVRTPLYNNGYALIISALATSGLGILYWALAARFYTNSEVGLSSAAISGMMLFSGISQLNLMGALIRFLPRGGESTARLVRLTYLASLVVSVLLGLGLVVLRDTWSPLPELFNDNTSFLLWFIVATMLWSVFALQDFVLTGLRQAKWVPIENVIFALVKILLLLLLASQFKLYGIFLSWTLPTLLAVGAMNALIFLRLIPRHVAQTREVAEPMVPRQLVRYVAGNYVGYLFSLLSTTLLPIMVKVENGANATAYFYLAWIFAYSLQLIAQNMTASLTVEGALEQHQLEVYSYRVLMNISRLVIPLVILFVIGAPYILDVFGPGYSAHGTDVLRLLALSAIPNIINVLYVSMARVRQRTSPIVVVQGVLCVLAIGFGYVFLRRYGITGLGVAWLLSQTIVAAVLMVTEMRTLLLPPMKRMLRGHV